MTTENTNYEYQTITVANASASVTSDAFEALGWELCDIAGEKANTMKKLSFRRPAQAAAPAPVKTLQHEFDGFGFSQRFQHLALTMNRRGCAA